MIRSVALLLRKLKTIPKVKHKRLNVGILNEMKLFSCNVILCRTTAIKESPMDKVTLGRLF